MYQYYICCMYLWYNFSTSHASHACLSYPYDHEYIYTIPTRTQVYGYVSIYSLPHTHTLGLSRCSSTHLFKNLSVIRTIQLFFGYGWQREGGLSRQWSAYSPSPSLFCISQVMIDSSRLQRPSVSYITAESVNWGGDWGGWAQCVFVGLSVLTLLCELWHERVYSAQQLYSDAYTPRVCLSAHKHCTAGCSNLLSVYALVNLNALVF